MENPGSGGKRISGWITTLFPYVGSSNIKKMQRNPLLDSRSSLFARTDITANSFPKGFVSTPFKWLYFGEEFEMSFYAGFLGVGQDKESLALRPVIGWAVVDQEEEEKAKMSDRRGHRSS